MALVVEDGTGLAKAESYISVEQADTYMTRMGHDAWATATQADKEKALRQATQYVDSRYRYKNQPLKPEQSLEWPRIGLPWPIKRVIDATCELAIRALTASLYTDVAPTDAVKSETIGPISTVYQESKNGGQVQYALVADLLRPLVATGQLMGIRLERG